jgi:hypothetical protein
MSAPSSVPATTTDPLHAAANRDSASPLQVGVVIAAAILIFIISVLYAFFRRVPRVRACLRDFDVFYDLTHYIREGANRTRHARALGGFFSVVALVVMVALVSIAVIEYALVPTYDRSLSPEAAPLHPVGLYNFSLVVYGAPSCDSPVITGPSETQLRGASSRGWAVSSIDGSCAMYWSCAACVYDSSALTTSFTLSGPNIYAAGMQYSLTFPAFSSAADGSSVNGAPFMLIGTLFPTPSVSSVFRGPTPTQISISLVSVVLRSSPPQVGTFAQPISLAPGSQANAVTAPFLPFFFCAPPPPPFL